jgi:hypothetical protein
MMLMEVVTMPTTITAQEEFAAHLRRIGACVEAREWAKGKTAREAWEQCDRADWLLWWVAAENGEAARPKLVRCACQCARLVLHLVPSGEQRPLLAIEAAERWADNPTADSLDKARQARRGAAAAAYAAYAAAYAAYAAAYAADAAAADAAAAYAATAAAYAADAAAAYAADAAAAAAYAAAAASKQIKTQCLEIVRAAFTCPWQGGVA